MSDKDLTPPHHPAHNIRLSPDQINDIISTLYPNHTAHVTEAPRAISYNNRIYFLEISPSQPRSQISQYPPPVDSADVKYAAPPPPIRKAVLKLSGHFFNQTKVQNEVASVLLLGRHCPSVPAPLVLAWSDDGKTISTYNRTIPVPASNTPPPTATSTDSSTSIRSNPKSPGWILLSHLPGRTLTVADLDSPSGPHLIHQIAQHNLAWRSNIPHMPFYGNFRHKTPEELVSSPTSTNTTTDDTTVIPTVTTAPSDQSFTIGGHFLQHRYNPVPQTTRLQYYDSHLRDQTQRVMSSSLYDIVRCDLVPEVAHFVDKILPHLSCLQPHQDRDGRQVGEVGWFSHMDMAPRNILVSEVDDGRGGKGLTVTGILDFEFAAMLPEMDEAVNACVRQKGDWEDRHWSALMREVASLSAAQRRDMVGGVKVRVPPSSSQNSSGDVANIPQDVFFDKTEWEEVKLLWKIIDNIAPWQIMDERKMGRDELLRRLDTAMKTVRAAIKLLEKLSTERQRYLESYGEKTGGSGKGKERELDEDTGDVMQGVEQKPTTVSSTLSMGGQTNESLRDSPKETVEAMQDVQHNETMKATKPHEPSPQPATKELQMNGLAPPPGNQVNSTDTKRRSWVRPEDL